MRAAASSRAAQRNGARARAARRPRDGGGRRRGGAQRGRSRGREPDCRGRRCPRSRGAGCVRKEHGLVDPVAVEDVPEDAAEVAGERGPAQVAGMGGGWFVEQSEEQRDEGDPRDGSMPGGMGPATGKQKSSRTEEMSARRRERARVARGGSGDRSRDSGGHVQVSGASLCR